MSSGGELEFQRAIDDLPGRIVAKIRFGDCWVWQASKLPSGYGVVGRIGDPKRTGLAHRVVFEVLTGPVPVGMELDHLCRNPSCVRPSHMEIVTPSVNRARANRDQLQERDGRCPKGHDDIGVSPDGRRNCRACSRERYARARA